MSYYVWSGLGGHHRRSQADRRGPACPPRARGGVEDHQQPQRGPGGAGVLSEGGRNCCLKLDMEKVVLYIILKYRSFKIGPGGGDRKALFISRHDLFSPHVFVVAYVLPIVFTVSSSVRVFRRGAAVVPPWFWPYTPSVLPPCLPLYALCSAFCVLNRRLFFFACFVVVFCRSPCPSLWLATSSERVGHS